MHRALLTAAASIAAFAATSPASAQSLTSGGFSSSTGTGRLEVLQGRPAPRGDFNRFDHRRHRHHHGGFGDGFVFGCCGYNDFYGDYDANRSFDPDRWNDWWHERPERAYPRWMSRNQGCERQWYSGDVLTC
jgi:hypothetical protein